MQIRFMSLYGPGGGSQSSPGLPLAGAWTSRSNLRPFVIFTAASRLSDLKVRGVCFALGTVSRSRAIQVGELPRSHLAGQWKSRQDPGPCGERAWIESTPPSSGRRGACCTGVECRFVRPSGGVRAIQRKAVGVETYRDNRFLTASKKTLAIWTALCASSRSTCKDTP